MGFSCKGENSGLTPIIIDNLDRDLGLSNIYNVNTDVGFCMENFNSPLYHLSGATKPYENIFSGCTDSNGDSSYLIDVGTVFGCPSGYTVTIGNDDCIQINVTGATSAATFYTITAGPNHVSYGAGGARFYGSLDGLEFPIQKNALGNTLNFVDAFNDPTPYPTNAYNPNGVALDILVSSINNSLWGLGTTGTGRLNNVGVWASGTPPLADEFIGFAECVDIPTAGKYWVGIAADNYLKFSVNGELKVIVHDPGNVGWSQGRWHMFQFDLNSGKNIIEMYGAGDASVSEAFACEIYSADTATLTGATTVGELGLLFTTDGLSGSLFNIGDSSGWSCPSGYALDTCVSGTPLCSEILRITGLTTTTGVTIDCNGIYNTSVLDSFDLTFNITGGTDYSGYTGQFCYEIYDGITSGDTMIYSACTDYSGITSSTVTLVLNSGVEIPISDGNYKVLTYNSFTPNDCGLNIISGKSIIGSTFDFSNDWYFTTVSNPPTPLFTEVVGNYQGGSLRTDTIQVVDGQTIYGLTQQPNGGTVIVNVNGITLTQNLDYILDYSALPSGPTLVSFISGDLELVDVVTFTYVTPGDPTQVTQTDTNLFSIETLVVGSVISGVTASTTNIVNYNIIEGIHEFFTQYDILQNSSIKLTINGIELTQGLDYFISNKTLNKINFHTNNIFFGGEIISVFYFKQDAVLQEGNLGKLDSNDVNIQWYITEALPTDSSGYFDVEITEESDITYSASTYTGTTEYVEDQLSYSLLFEDVGVNKKYIYKVCMNKTSTTITNDDLTTSVCSENGSFDLTSGTAIYNNI